MMKSVLLALVLVSTTAICAYAEAVKFVAPKGSDTLYKEVTISGVSVVPKVVQNQIKMTVEVDGRKAALDTLAGASALTDKLAEIKVSLGSWSNQEQPVNSADEASESSLVVKIITLEDGQIVDVSVSQENYDTKDIYDGPFVYSAVQYVEQ